MKHKQLIFVNIIIFIILISVVRMGIKKENIAHAHFIEESRQFENNQDERSHVALTDYYHDLTLTLEDIKHPPWFNEEHISISDEEEIELEDDLEEEEEEEETEIADQENNHEEISTETENLTGIPNNSNNQGISNQSSPTSLPVQEGSSKDKSDDNGEEEDEKNSGENTEEKDDDGDPIKEEEPNPELNDPGQSRPDGSEENQPEDDEEV